MGNEPTRRVVRTARPAPPSYSGQRTSRVSYDGYRVMAVRQHGGRRRRLRRLVAVAALVLGVFWIIQHVHLVGHVAADALRRVLGVQTTAQVETLYGNALDAAQSLHDTVLGTAPAPVASAPPPPLRGRHGTGTMAHPAARATALVSPSATAVTAVVHVHVHSMLGQPMPTHTVRTTRRAARTGLQGVAARTVPPLPTQLRHLPATMLLQNNYQVYETWNNCGPASLSMALSYFGIHVSQAVLGEALRPYQNPYGNNDDKDVTWQELANQARTYGLLAYYRPDGNIQLLKRFLAIGLPVMAETVMTLNDDIGHYRVVKGYNDTTGTITQDDSMQGHNIQFTYADFNAMWKKYNYEYMVLVPKAKQRLAEAILGNDLNVQTAWHNTVTMDQAALAEHPSDVTSRFNLSVALYYIHQYKKSVREFEMVQNQLPPRTLWYQIEPIEAYYALGGYRQVFSLSAAILNNGNRAFSQLYILRGEIDLKEGNRQAAKAEFENAVYYNKHLKAAQEALRSVS